MSSYRYLWHATALCTALAMGCGGEDYICKPGQPPPGEQVGTMQQPSTCPVQECGANSAEINEIPIGELHVVPGENTGEVNQWGAQLRDFVAPDGSTDYVARFDMGRLFADNGERRLDGPDLIGSIFTVLNTNTGDELQLQIRDLSLIPSWTDQGFLVERFVFGYYDCGLLGFAPICQDAMELPDEEAWSVIVGGERYSWEDKDAFASGDDARGWFNIACYDNALYKMKFTGYDPQPTGDNPYVSAPEDRTATLKMMTADYCGTGTSFTETGTPLYWINAEGWSSNSVPVDAVSEALWDETGALCLDEPRLGNDILQDIIDECATVGKVLGPCSEYNGAYVWETYNPVAP